MLLQQAITSLSVIALVRSIDNDAADGGRPLLFAYANTPPTSPRMSRFTRKKRRYNEQRSSSDGLTLGDLESMQQQAASSNHGFIPTGSIFDQNEHQDMQSVDDDATSDQTSSSSSGHQLRRSLRRINLDLSGRVMCHLLSPTPNNHDDDGSSATLPMSSMPLFQLPSAALRRLHRRIPHIYIGANYDLDEVWYGATRWIAKCSWQLPKHRSNEKMSQLIQGAYNCIFPTTTKTSAWMLDVEGEQSVFDHSDSTARVSLVHRCQPVIPRVGSYSSPSDNQLDSTIKSLQKVSMEYDSAKYSTNNPSTLTHAPTISFNVQTPIFHRRIELRAKTTWIVQEGGDRHDNYYGGSHYGSYSPAKRRFDSIREGYRAMVPRSQNISSKDASQLSTTTTTSKMGRLQSFGRKLSTWLEEDGWVPKRVTTDLMGNFVSLNEVGFGGGPSVQSDSSGDSSSINSNNHLDNMGIRLRVSKRIGWTSLGIFPWSNNNSNSYTGSSNNARVTPTRVRLDLCTLHKSGYSISQIGCNFDPLDWVNTFKVVIGHDGVASL